MQSKPVKPLRYILLDTSIFQHLGNRDLYPQIINLLRDAISKGYGISMSKYSVFELLDTANIENELKAMDAIRGIKHFKINETVLVVAGHLGSLYMEDGLDNKKQPEKGDKIVAGTAIINNAVIFTTNGRDFPTPFFNIIYKPHMNYKQTDGREACIFGYFIEPDLETLSIKYQQRIQKHDAKKLVINKK